jgi:hypothetical protein
MKTDSSEQAVRRVPLADMSGAHARFAMPADGLAHDDARLPVADERGAAAARSVYLAQFAAPTLRNLIHE